MADEATQGVNAFQTQQAISRKTMALNALRSVYGDKAGDPEAAGQLQEQAQSEQLFPGKLAQQGATLASTQAGTAQTQQTTQLAGAQAQREGQYRAITMLQDSVNPQTGAVDADTFDRIVGSNAQTLGLDPAHVQPLKDALTAPGGAQHLDTIRRGLIAPTAATGQPIVAQGPNGQSVLITHDRYGNPSQQSLAPGVTPVSQQQANTATARLTEKTAQDKLLDDLAAGRLNVQQYKARLAAANANNLPDTAPPSGGAPAAPSAAPAASTRFDRLPQGSKARDNAVGFAQSLSSQKVNLDNANFIADSMEKQIGPYSTGAGSFLDRIPASLATDLEANAKTMNSAAAYAVLQGMKNAQGNTGVGRILQSEYANFTTQLGNLNDRRQSDVQYLQHLRLARAALNNLFKAQSDGFKTKYEKDYAEVIPPAPAPTGQAPAPSGGFKYLGKE
jgi:hypothetical protein